MMDFKIKMKRGYFATMILLGFLVFAGGVLFGIAVYDVNDPLQVNLKAPVACVGLGMTTGSLWILCDTFKTLSRQEADIDIDSFTEAEIDNKVEERWKKIKEQANSQKQST